MLTRTERAWPTLTALFLLSTSCAPQPEPSAPRHPVVRGSTGTTSASPRPNARAGGGRLVGAVREQGRFLLYVKGTLLATVHHQGMKSGLYQSRRVVKIAGQTLVTRLTVTPDERGHWKRIELHKPGGPLLATRKGGQVVYTHRGKKTALKLPREAVLYESQAPALMSSLIEAYDRARGGEQTVKMFPLGGRVASVRLRLDWTRTLTVGKQRHQVSRFTVAMQSGSVDVYVDARGRVLLVDIPIRYAYWVRSGFASIRPRPVVDPKLSKPVFKVRVERNVKIPMRDGLRLATTIFRPARAGKYPVILVRTPYKKEMNELDARFYATRGYAVALQDVRGRFASPGKWEPFVNEGKDGHDTIEWLARQPWSTGKVGMIGASYVGWVQWWAAAERPKHLVTIIPNVSPPDPFFNIPYEYGVFFLLGAIWWAEILETGATGSLDGVAMQKIGDRRYGDLLKHLPVIDLDKRILGKKNAYWRKWISHPTNDAYWRRASFMHKLKGVSIPVFHQSGWFDGDGIGSKLNFAAMKKHHHRYQKLVLGPWGHTARATRRHAGRDFGPRALVDLQRMYLRWFDRWLKGVQNSIEREPLVQIFVMGTNTWLKGDTYPLKGTRMERWYLSSGGHANTSAGDGILTKVRPVRRARSDRYIYDPGDPTPDPRFWQPPRRKKGQVISGDRLKAQAQAHHAKVTRSRSDILVYTSAPMAHRYTFAGPMSAVIHASTTARDTDWFVRLCEVDAKGKIFVLAQGKIRARFRASMSRPRLLVKGRVYRYEIDLWQTGITIPKGARLRVEIASAAFPFFSRNLNTGGHNETETRHVKATQTILHDRRHPSYVLLPRIPTRLVNRAAARAATPPRPTRGRP